MHRKKITTVAIKLMPDVTKSRTINKQKYLKSKLIKELDLIIYKLDKNEKNLVSDANKKFAKSPLLSKLIIE